jgi:hypothetical protein
MGPGTAHMPAAHFSREDEPQRRPEDGGATDELVNSYLTILACSWKIRRAALGA